jgi:CCR4-NOT complex subunit CAF16
MVTPAATTVAKVEESEEVEESVIEVRSLTFAYPGTAPQLSDMSLRLPAGARCLLCGSNGSGKTTLLSILAGKCMVDKHAVQVLGRPPFHDTALTCNGDLSFLGSQWRRNVSFAGYDVPLQGDFPAGRMIYNMEGADLERRERLVKMLDIDPTWSMMQVSDGQRRRVQICLGLLKEYKVLLCDEITVDLDIIGRLDLLNFLQQECSERGATIIYATHIFDGMEKWLTHLAFVEDGQLKKAGHVSTVPELQRDEKLLRVMERWLREERSKRDEGAEKRKKQDETPMRNLLPAKHMAYMS